MAGVNLERLAGQPMAADTFPVWERVAAALEQHHMPPKGMPQLTGEQHAQAVAWVRSELKAFANKNAGDPGRVTVRRLTSGEYDYVVQDLTGVDLDVGIDASTDSVGGEGFTNFGDVQFVQDATLERYLEAAKKVADHAVIGAGPIEFYTDPARPASRCPPSRASNGFMKRTASAPSPVKAASPSGSKVRQGPLRRLAVPAPRRLGRAGHCAEGSRRARRHHRPVRPAHLDGHEHSVAGLSLE